MQSSGASLGALLLAQIPGSLAIIDLWSERVAPRLTTALPIVVKVIVTNIELQIHAANFRPTFKILFLRDPAAVVSSLSDKDYAGDGGSVEAKLSWLDEVFMRRESLFDTTMLYEDLTGAPTSTVARLRRFGLPVPLNAAELPRSPQEIVEHSCRHSLWCRRNYEDGWGLGNIHVANIRPLRMLRAMPDHHARLIAQRRAPNLSEFYDGRNYGEPPDDPPAGTYAVHHAEMSWQTPAYRETSHARLAALAEALDQLPGQAIVIVVDDEIGVRSLCRRPTLSFLELDGRYLGNPANDHEAIARLARLQALGASHIAFAGPARWWLDYYTGFHRHVEAIGRRLEAANGLALFALSR
jgi:hypothetical protein